MLPFDNKSEFQVIVDMPNGTTLEETARVAQLLGEETQKQREVVNVQTYAGTASPYNFNGLVRHYYLRRGPNVADIQVNLLPKGGRDLQSHEIAKQVRLRIAAHRRALWRANQGGRSAARTAGARDTGRGSIRAERWTGGSRWRGKSAICSSRPKVSWTSIGTWKTIKRNTACSWTRRRPPSTAFPKTTSHARCRWPPPVITAGLLHQDAEKEDVSLTVRLDRATRSDLERIQGLKIAGRNGRTVSLGELVHVRKRGRGQEHLSQEPDAGDLCHGRHCGRDRKPGLCSAQTRAGDRQDQDPGRLPDRAAHGGASLRPGPLLDEVGRRMAHHL